MVFFSAKCWRPDIRTFSANWSVLQSKHRQCFRFFQIWHIYWNKDVLVQQDYTTLQKYRESYQSRGRIGPSAGHGDPVPGWEDGPVVLFSNILGRSRQMYWYHRCIALDVDPTLIRLPATQVDLFEWVPDNCRLSSKPNQGLPVLLPRFRFLWFL